MAPSDVMGIILIFVALLMFALELKAPGLGVLGVAGVIAFAGGMIMIFGASWATMPVILVIALAFSAVLAFLSVLAHRARRNKVVTGNSGMVGLEGRTESALEPDGRVLVRGELWDAWSPVRLERGQAVRVTGVRGLRLEVESVNLGLCDVQPVSVIQLDDDAREPAQRTSRGKL